MRRIALLLALAALALPRAADAQYTITAPHLADPNLAVGYVDSCAGFWLGAWDGVHGGWYTNIARDTSQLSEWGTHKTLLSQTRNAYGLVRAYQLTGHEPYLEAALTGLDWMWNHYWDDDGGGWYVQVSESGQVEGSAWDRSAFDSHYALLGLAAAWEATGDSASLARLQQAWTWVDTAYWDDRAGVAGYYDVVAHDGSNPRGKSFNATVDAVTTHALPFVLWGWDGIHQARYDFLNSQMQHRLVATMPQQAIGFAEEFSSEWSIIEGETMTLMGHVLKTAWCLARSVQLDYDGGRLDDALTCAEDVWSLGYDHTWGGPYKDFNRVTGEEITWGQEPGVKAWWQMEQAVTAGLMLFDLTIDDNWLEMADETVAFFMEHFVDQQYGEVYENRTRTGGFVWNDAKGMGGKAAYHSVELGWYLYLYGNLLTHNREATVHYRFAPADSARSIALTPMAIPDDRLAIASVTLDGTGYTDYDANGRQLNIPAGEGGQFAVTFEPLWSSAPEGVLASRPERIELAPPWPNPFNSNASLAFQLPRRGQARVALYDALGRRVAVLREGVLDAGRHRVQLQGDHLASGVYFARVSQGAASASRRMVLVK